MTGPAPTPPPPPPSLTAPQRPPQRPQRPPRLRRPCWAASRRCCHLGRPAGREAERSTPRSFPPLPPRPAAVVRSPHGTGGGGRAGPPRPAGGGRGWGRGHPALPAAPSASLTCWRPGAPPRYGEAAGPKRGGRGGRLREALPLGSLELLL